MLSTVAMMAATASGQPKYVFWCRLFDGLPVI
jgi:hypothetical protein